MATNFSDVLQELGSADQPLKADAIYGLSGLSEEDLKALQAAWGAIPVERRRSLVQRLSEAAETNFDMDFEGVTRLALTDLDDHVRAAAIETTWHDETTDMATRLIAMASGDISQDVRAAAVSALGRYILLGELGKFDPAVARRAENIAIKLYNDHNQDVNVRRRALEAIANCGREGVTQMIEQAYADKNKQMRASAIHAMGSSYDQHWANIVLREFASNDPELRYEAVRSAGELELRDAVPHLAEILHENDREIQEMAIWALGEIGGEDARDLLEAEMERADEQGDDSLAEAIEEALESANLASHNLAL
jgi:HEAT repeat protein